RTSGESLCGGGRHQRITGRTDEQRGTTGLARHPNGSGGERAKETRRVGTKSPLLAGCVGKEQPRILAVGHRQLPPEPSRAAKSRPAEARRRLAHVVSPEKGGDRDDCPYVRP